VRFSESSDSEKSAEGVAGHDERGLILEGSILAYHQDLPFKKLQRQPSGVIIYKQKTILRWRREQVALAARDNIITAIAA
jgi:hypothetical protein